MAVNTSVRQKTDEVQRARSRRAAIHRGDQRRNRKEFTVRDRLVDTRQVLVDHAPRAHVHVTDLGVSHLPRGQADAFA